MLSTIESKVILALIILLSLSGVALYLEEGRISKLNQTIGSDKQELVSLKAGVATQDKAIQAGNALAAQREKVAADAVEAAQNEAKHAMATAASILAKHAPKGSYATQCLAASKSFDAELRQERHQ